MFKYKNLKKKAIHQNIISYLFIRVAKVALK